MPATTLELARQIGDGFGAAVTFTRATIGARRDGRQRHREASRAESRRCRCSWFRRASRAPWTPAAPPFARHDRATSSRRAAAAVPTSGRRLRACPRARPRCRRARAHRQRAGRRSQHDVADRDVGPGDAADVEPAIGAADEAAGLAHDGAHHVGAGRHVEVDAVRADAGRRRAVAVCGSGIVSVPLATTRPSRTSRTRKTTSAASCAVVAHRQVRLERQQHAGASGVVGSQHVGGVVDAKRLLRERRGQRGVDRAAAIDGARPPSARRNRCAR